MSKTKIAAIGFGVLVVLSALAGAPKSNLTPEQKLEITDKCIQNPDSLMCQ